MSCVIAIGDIVIKDFLIQTRYRVRMIFKSIFISVFNALNYLTNLKKQPTNKMNKNNYSYFEYEDFQPISNDPNENDYELEYDDISTNKMFYKDDYSSSSDEFTIPDSQNNFFPNRTNNEKYSKDPISKTNSKNKSINNIHSNNRKNTIKNQNISEGAKYKNNIDTNNSNNSQKSAQSNNIKMIQVPQKNSNNSKKQAQEKTNNLNDSKNLSQKNLNNSKKLTQEKTNNLTESKNPPHKNLSNSQKSAQSNNNTKQMPQKIFNNSQKQTQENQLKDPKNQPKKSSTQNLLQASFNYNFVFDPKSTEFDYDYDETDSYSDFVNEVKSNQSPIFSFSPTSKTNSINNKFNNQNAFIFDQLTETDDEEYEDDKNDKNDKKKTFSKINK